MAGQSLQTTGYVLQKPPAQDRHQQVLLFSPDGGQMLCFQRLSSRQPAVALDLFDEVAATLTSTNQGRTWFFSEVRVVRRFAGVGLSFAAHTVLGLWIAVGVPALLAAIHLGRKESRDE